MKLHELKSKPGARDHKKKIVGRGHGSGMGKTSTRGMKGQKARKSGKTRLGFEGGQTPLFRRLPKIGFNNYRFASNVQTVTLEAINRLENIDVSKAYLKEMRLIKNVNFPVKLIGNTKLSKAYNISAEFSSKGALSAIEAAGGKINQPLVKEN